MVVRGAILLAVRLYKDWVFFFNSTAGKPHIDLDGGPTYAKENTTITLPKCHVTGSPTPEVEWSKVGGNFHVDSVNRALFKRPPPVFQFSCKKKQTKQTNKQQQQQNNNSVV